jgi:AbrB family looped-hinge helix DNA binding protein
MINLRTLLKVRKKGIIIIPKRIRIAANLEEDDVVIAEVKEGALVLKSLKPKVVDINPNIIDTLLKEEKELEEKKHERISKREKTSS